MSTQTVLLVFAAVAVLGLIIWLAVDHLGKTAASNVDTSQIGTGAVNALFTNLGGSNG